MHPHLRICAGRKKRGRFTWTFVDEEMRAMNVRPESLPDGVQKGDIWIVEQIKTLPPRKAGGRQTAVVRLVARERGLKPWETMTRLHDHWMPVDQLKDMICQIYLGHHLIIKGDPGTGKTRLAYAIAETLEWPVPCKVQTDTIRRPAEFFGSDAAKSGSTVFEKSVMLLFIEQAQESLARGEDKRFLIILDEWNRCHPKQKQGMLGLLDHTKLVSFTSVDGSVTVRLPENVNFIATVNIGPSHQGTFPIDENDKNRFTAYHVQPMPCQVEEGWLVEQTGVTKADAAKIAKIADLLRKSRSIRHLSYSPSFRDCKRVAEMIYAGRPFMRALISGLFGWYQGKKEFDSEGNVIDSTSEFAKAWEAVHTSIDKKELGDTRDLVINGAA